MLAGIDIGGTKCAVAVGGLRADCMAELGAEWIIYITPAQWAFLQVILVWLDFVKFVFTLVLFNR